MAACHAQNIVGVQRAVPKEIKYARIFGPSIQLW